ncbi:unnamed protein product [Periconia digitata]|uniref:Uncharacterized protein n=1 Tax=Periconia digitata TaxID=1303443 RepID=A0A9W4XXN9_9PLEO|nr:unnamed protein product [Periconia digitata]
MIYTGKLARYLCMWLVTDGRTDRIDHWNHAVQLLTKDVPQPAQAVLQEDKSRDTKNGCSSVKVGRAQAGYSEAEIRMYMGYKKIKIKVKAAPIG